MIVTKGLGGNLLITQGYGGLAVLKFYPYCTGVVLMAHDPAQVYAPTLAPYQPAGQLVQNAASFYGRAPNSINGMPAPYTAAAAPYTQPAPPYSKAAGIYNDGELPFEQLPNNCS